MEESYTQLGHIEACELYEMFKSLNINVIDIREPHEHKVNTLKGTINIPMKTLIDNYKILLNNNEIYYLLCRSGTRSFHLGEYLAKLGYNVVNVDGGFLNMQQIKKEINYEE